MLNMPEWTYLSVNRYWQCSGVIALCGVIPLHRQKKYTGIKYKITAGTVCFPPGSTIPPSFSRQVPISAINNKNSFPPGFQ